MDGPSAALASLAVDAQTAEVVQRLHQADVPCLLLKGPSIAGWLYNDGTPRPYGDSDLLVPPHAYATAAEVLG
ncbi:MAG: nucleotidyltransferase family protein, partial [Actinobacteria bacterium]|nr:nucleotidyltransferase family protein [Actinomycetota bacterium]